MGESCAAGTRKPTEAEAADFTATLAALPPEQKRDAVIDYTWAMLTSVEFRFSH
jgi:hypothetical protein